MGCAPATFWGGHRTSDAGLDTGTQEEVRCGRRQRGESARCAAVAALDAPASGEGWSSLCAAARSAARSAPRRSSALNADVLAARSCLLILMRCVIMTTTVCPLRVSVA
jgi:hypothetical protein